MLCRRNQGIKVCWGNEKLAGADLGTCLDIVGGLLGSSWVGRERVSCSPGAFLGRVWQCSRVVEGSSGAALKKMDHLATNEPGASDPEQSMFKLSARPKGDYPFRGEGK